MRDLPAPARSRLGIAPSVSAGRRIVLITGCSIGIGRSSALAFLSRGWVVIATARQLASIADLEQAGCHCYQLDVTDEQSMQNTLDEVERRFGTVDVLVNNAGYGLYGPVEQLSRKALIDQFETNVFGLVRLSQLVLPGMRAGHFGRIVNVSSVAGRFSLPMGGAYCASKHAVEALSDALRYEARQFGVAVILVEPGPVRTHWASTAISSVEIDTAASLDPYREIKLAAIGELVDMTEGKVARFATTPDRVAGVIVRAASSRRPRSRYRAGFLAHLLVALRWMLPDVAFDLVVGRTSVSI